MRIRTLCICIWILFLITIGKLLIDNYFFITHNNPNIPIRDNKNHFIASDTLVDDEDYFYDYDYDEDRSEHWSIMKSDKKELKNSTDLYFI